MKKLLLLIFLMTISLGQSQTITGTWKVTSIGVGPGQGNTGWWGLSVNSGDRACFFDDLYKFNANGTFENIQGTETWTEGWQGGSDSCGTPAAPHNGSNAATYTSTASSLTLNGVGAYLGMAKVINGAEINNASNAPASITYQISSLTSTTLTVDISIGTGWWRYVLAKQVENAPVLSGFSIPSKSVGSAAFTITPPTSNSTGAFTYTSSDTSVATVSGSTITVVGVGSTTITAMQAASGSFASGTITAILDVTPSAAPNPTISSSSIIGLYTDAYPSDDIIIDMGTFLTSWSAASLSNIQIGSNNILKYSNVSYLGIEPTAPVDATAMNLFHLDLYTTNMTAFRVKLVDFGANGIYGGGDDSEHELSMTPTLNGWNSYNLLLSSFTNMTGKAHIAQIVLSGNPAGSGLMFIDNMYFGNQAITVAPLLSAFTIASKATGDADFAITAPTSTSTGAFTYTSSDTSVATIVNGNSIHIVGIGTTTITATQAAAGSYTSGSITTSFVVTLPVATAPTTAAPTPPSRNASDVVSIFSGAYSNATLSELPTDWSQLALSPFSVETIAGNATWKFGGEFLGMVTNYDNGIDLTQMTTMHIDYWTPDNKIMIAKIVNTTGPVTEGLTIVQDPVVTGTWRSVDIPMAQFGTSVNKSKITQILLDPQLGGSKVYIDNFYFYRDATSTPAPTLSGFAVAPKVVGDATFILTDPTSNSTGSFTYTSSNPAVATVSGNIVTIVGAGNTTITATQAAAGAYGSGVITANFVVSATAATAPTTSAPTPPSRNAWDVVSLFSGAYSNATLNEIPTGWSQLTDPFETVTIDGNNTWKFKGEFLGMVTNYDTGVNLSQMTTMHIDYWTPDTNRIDLKLVNTVLGGEAFTAIEPTTVAGTWRSIDVPLADYGSLNRSNITQILIDPAGVSKIYIDNLYFYRSATSLPAPTLSGFAVAPKVVGDATFTLTAPTSNSTGAFTYTSSNNAVATISGSTVTIVGAGSTTITATQAAAGSYGEGVITTNFIVSLPPPTTAAPTPTVPADRVLSIFSDAYINQGGASYPYWGQPAGYIAPAVTQIGTPGDNTLKVDNLSYQGIQLASNINVSTMTTLHVDIWTPNCTTLEFYLIDSAPVGVPPTEQAVSVSLTQNGWNSIDIPMSSYNTLALTAVQQFKLVGSPAGSVLYLDNIYFIKPATVEAPSATAQTFCNSGTVADLVATGTALKWYANATGGSALASDVALVSGNYYVSQTLNSIESPRTLVAITITNGIAVQPMDANICTTATTSTASISVVSSGGTPTYAWQYATALLPTTWITITAANASTVYTTYTSATLNIKKSATLLTGTKYRVILTNGLCGTVTSNVVTLTVNPLSVVKTISGAGAICNGASKTLTLATGSVGSIQWQSSTTSATATDFADISGATDPVSLTVSPAVTTWYRVVAKSGACSSIASAAVAVTVTQPTTVGSLSALTTTLCTATGTTLSLSSAAGTIAWQKATVTSGVTGTFAAVAGNVTTTLATGNLTSTTAYRVVVSSGTCSTSISDPITITVNPVSTVKTISGAGAICNGASKTLTLATGSVGSIQWQSSTTSATATDFADISGAIDPVTLIVSPSVTTWYRAVSTSGVCSSKASVAVAVSVSQPTAVGTLSALTTTLCTGTGTTLNLSSAAGTIAWQKATVTSGVTGTFAAVAGNVTTTLATGNLAATTAYRVVVSNGACAASTSNPITITVSALAKATGVTGHTGATTLATAVCSGARTLTLATGYIGSIQWQYYNAGTSTTAVTNTTVATWTNINGATSANFNAISSTSGNVWYRVKLTSGPCATLAYSTPVNVWIKACTESLREEASIEFKATAYPNPFAENFKLDVKTSSEEALQINVYDMLGKLVESRILETTEVEGLEVGANYTSGVYNVIVSQGDTVKTLRVIKR
ncbi:Ig-like domain-containing protein [Flavobacterium sp.]|uniref:Ig-like domain-containing protein n=1 Tax=Flavobacterium sp. TaxID=239 RepID=UPI003BDF7E2F